MHKMKVAVAALLVLVIYFGFIFSGLWIPLTALASSSLNTHHTNSNFLIIARAGSHYSPTAENNWSIGYPVANFKLTRSAVVTGSWSSTMPTYVEFWKFSLNKSSLIPPSGASWLTEGSINVSLSPGTYYFYFFTSSRNGQVIHNNFTITQNILASYT